MMIASQIDMEMIQHWMKEKLDMKAVEERLQQTITDKETKDAYIRIYKQLRNVKRQTRGFMFSGLGAFIGFAGGILSVLNPVPELFYFFLFGLTSLAVILVVLGLYFLFE
jgi:hypothetical protein